MLLGFRTLPFLPSKLVQNPLKIRCKMEIEVTSLLEVTSLSCAAKKCRGFSVFIFLNYILVLHQLPPQDKQRPAFPSVSSLNPAVTVEGAGLLLAGPSERGSAGLGPSGQFLTPGSPVRSHTPPSWEGGRQGQRLRECSRRQARVFLCFNKYKSIQRRSKAIFLIIEKQCMHMVLKEMSKRYKTKKEGFCCISLPHFSSPPLLHS